jgi:hypothetical protein
MYNQFKLYFCRPKENIRDCNLDVFSVDYNKQMYQHKIRAISLTGK